MRKIKITFVIIMCFAILPFFGLTLSTDSFAADDEGYTYSILIYSGNEGYFGSPGKTVKKIDGLEYGQQYTIDASKLGLKIKDSSKYYLRGFKLSGHDNDEIASRTYQSYTFKVTGDMSFSAAYGMKGGMVKYIVKYQEKDTGKALLDTDTFYGMAGDKPVVACKYIEGYTPDAANVTKTLSDNEADNEFVFTYTAAESGTTPDDEGGDNGEGDNGEGGDNGDNNGDNNGAPGVGDNGTNTAYPQDSGTDVDGTDSDGDDVVNLDDDDVAKAKNDSSGGVPWWVFALIAAAVAAGLIAFFASRRKNREEE